MDRKKFLELWIMVTRGNRDRENELVKEWEENGKRIAAEYNRRGVEYEESYSACLLGLAECIHAWRNRSGGYDRQATVSYVLGCIEKYARRENRRLLAQADSGGICSKTHFGKRNTWYKTLLREIREKGVEEAAKKYGMTVSLVNDINEALNMVRVEQSVESVSSVEDVDE